MTQSITLDQILLLAYGELPESMFPAVLSAMEKDPAFKKYYEDCLKMKAELGTISEEPHPTSVAIVTEHSHDSHTEAV